MSLILPLDSMRAALQTSSSTKTSYIREPRLSITRYFTKGWTKSGRHRSQKFSDIVHRPRLVWKMSWRGGLRDLDSRPWAAIFHELWGERVERGDSVLAW